MPVAFYMDVHLPAAITQALRRRHVDAITSQEDGTRRASDEALLARATELGRVLVSQDTDLLGIVAKWQSLGQGFSGLIFAPQQPANIGRYIDDLELIAVCCEQSELANTIQRLPLR